MFDDAELYSRSRSVATRDAHKLLDSVHEKMAWTDSDVVMDVGCGPGDSARDVLLPRIPRLKKLIAIDVLPGMIEFAKSKRSHEKIEHHVADVGNWVTLQRWQEKVSKIISVHCLHWLKNQEQAFENIFKLLSPGGEAALTFILSTSVWETHPLVIAKDRWNKYLKDIDQHVPSSHYLKYEENHYRNVFKTIGFEVVTCEKNDMNFAFDDGSEFKMFIKAICPLHSHIPDDECEEFLDDLFETMIEKYPRRADGKYVYHYACLIVHVKKN